MRREIFGLNILSLIYGIGFFIIEELSLDAYRLSRVANMGIHYFHVVTWVQLAGVPVILGLIVVFLIKFRIQFFPMMYWSMVLCFVYAFILHCIYALLFPTIDQGDMSAPGAGLGLFLYMFLYFFYVGFVNVIAHAGQGWSTFD